MYGITRTVAEVISDVTRQFGDESGVQVTNDDILRWINEAQTYIAIKTKFLKAKVVLPYQSSNNYTLTDISNLYQLESIHFDGTPIRNMVFAEVEEYILSADPALTEAGSPLIWYEWAGTVSFWPKPSNPPSSGNIELYVTKLPTASAIGGNLKVSDDYYPDVLNYVMQKAYELDEDFQNSQIKQKQISDSLNEKIDENRTAQSMTYSTITTYDL